MDFNAAGSLPCHKFGIMTVKGRGSFTASGRIETSFAIGEATI
jgi:hypothetical protein